MYSSRSRPSTFEQGNITWALCDDYIQCGQLEVPLDYFNPSAGKVTLALARYPATNKSGRLGTLLMNPGGPGGSGVLFIHRAGAGISKLLDGRYDIVSWDPRGVNGTTPRVECFSSQTAQDIAVANIHEEILPDLRNLSDPYDRVAFEAGLKLADTRNEAFVHLCEQRSGDTLKYVGTASVVRDIERLASELEGEGIEINYWGFSYGTVIGTYLVNMFPDRIGRVVIDAVVDPVMWTNDYPTKWWRWQFADTENTLRNFYRACIEAGPDRCALASKGSSAGDISKSVDDLIERLYELPLAVHNSTRPGPLTASMIQTSIFNALYRPLEWPELASKLASALEGNGVPIVDQFLKEITLAVQELVDEMTSAQRSSIHFAGILIALCHHMTVRSVERFTGPFNHSLSNEILVIGNTADPITPLQNAKKVNGLLSHSSRLVIQDGSGHASLAMASLCTANILREYFLEGKLPQNGIVCPTDEVLFPPKSPNSRDDLTWLKTEGKVYSRYDLELLKTVRELGEALKPRGLGIHFSI